MASLLLQCARISRIKDRIRHSQGKIHLCFRQICYFCPILDKTELGRRILLNPSTGVRVASSEQTNGQTDRQI
jgi:hypothetical protein